MRTSIDRLCIGVQLRVRRFIQEMKEESGVSGIVAAVILVLLAVLLASMFWDSLKVFFGSLWGDVTNNAKYTK